LSSPSRSVRHVDMCFSRSVSSWMHRKLADLEVDRQGGIASQTLKKKESLGDV
jgi:hypothetical protein